MNYMCQPINTACVVYCSTFSGDNVPERACESGDLALSRQDLDARLDRVERVD